MPSKEYSANTYGFRVNDFSFPLRIPKEGAVYSSIAWEFDCSRGYPLTTDSEVRGCLESNPLAYLDWYLKTKRCAFFSPKEKGYLKDETWVISVNPDKGFGTSWGKPVDSSFWPIALEAISKELSIISLVVNKEFRGYIYG